MGVHLKGINPINFLALLVFVMFLVCMEYVSAVETLTRCIDSEREALLRFKLSLTNDGGLLSSWGSGDHQKECCKWDRVVCSNTTGYVIALQLSGDYLYGLEGKINSSLLELHHLNYLDLSHNDFGGIRIPEFIGSIKTLQHLDFSHSNFSGSIPPQLGNLTNLRTLVLSRFWLDNNNHLWSDNLYWLSHLSFLTHLDLSWSYISDANWLQHVLNLPSLQKLYMSSCMLTDVAKSSVGLFVNSSSSYSTSLSVLELLDNELTSTSIFDWIFNISCSFVVVDVSYNQLDGPIPDVFGKLIFLEFLDLSHNMLQGGIPKSWGNLSHLRELRFSENDLGEPFEELLGKLSCRQRLVLLELSNTQLTGPVTAASLAQLSKLKSLYLSYNSLTLDLSPGWIPPFHLEEIGLARCKMGPSFPSWLQTQSNFYYLDISDTDVSDEVPKWFWNLTYSANYLNLSHNQIRGTIPHLSSIPLEVIDVSSNKFSGPLPLLPPSTAVVQLSLNQLSGTISSICTNYSYIDLQLLDLANNHLEGSLPDYWENMNDLIVLNLNNNNFSGEIPHSLGYLWNLHTLHLRGNNFSGKLPSTLKNFRFLQSIDIGGNKITGHIPPWLGNGNHRSMVYLSLRQNRFYGSIPPEICNLSQIQVLDLSGNNISGKIPQCFNNFTSLVDMNRTTRTTIRVIIGDAYIDYALVQWKGQESEYKNTLGLLKHIDLSRNRLDGSIPKAFSCLRGLISLNLSRNSLTGSIDPDIGKMEMLETLDLSRNQSWVRYPLVWHNYIFWLFLIWRPTICRVKFH